MNKLVQLNALAIVMADSSMKPVAKTPRPAGHWRNPTNKYVPRVKDVKSKYDYEALERAAAKRLRRGVGRLPMP